MHLKGKVKSIAETTQYAYPPRKLATMKMQSPIPTLYSFNQRGYLTEKSIGADIKYVYQYDRYQHYLSGGKKYVYSDKIKADIMFIRVKDGAFWEELTFYKKKIEKLRIDYLSPVYCKISHTIDRKLFDEKEIYYQKPYSYSKIDYILRDGKKEVYTYNDQGYLIESISKDEDNKTLSSNLYEYDQKGNRTRHDLLTADGNLFMSTFSKYNDKNQLIEKSNCVGGVCDEKSVLTYDDKGYLIQEEKYKKDELSTKTLYKNDAKGNPLERLTYDAEGKLLKKITSTYDKEGNETENIVYKGDGTIAQKKNYVYQYDKYKNWIKRTESENGELSLIIQQKFEYYK